MIGCLVVSAALDYSGGGKGVKFIFLLFKVSFVQWIGPMVVYINEILPGVGVGYVWGFFWILQTITY